MLEMCGGEGCIPRRCERRGEAPRNKTAEGTIRVATATQAAAPEGCSPTGEHAAADDEDDMYIYIFIYIYICTRGPRGGSQGPGP